MKYVCFIVILACALFIGACQAAGEGESAQPGTKEVKVDRDQDGTMDGVDIYNEEGKVVRRGYDTNGDTVMETWESYDPNTGLPDVVPSDRYGEIR